MGGDCVDVGIPLGPVTISVNGLLRKLFGRKEQGHTDVVAERFLTVFGTHGVEVTQNPRLLPTMGLDVLNSRESVLKALTCKVALSPDESAQSKEAEELPSLIKYIETTRLDVRGAQFREKYEIAVGSVDEDSGEVCDAN